MTCESDLEKSSSFSRNRSVLELLLLAASICVDLLGRLWSVGQMRVCSLKETVFVASSLREWDRFSNGTNPVNVDT